MHREFSSKMFDYRSEKSAARNSTKGKKSIAAWRLLLVRLYSSTYILFSASKPPRLPFLINDLSLSSSRRLTSEMGIALSSSLSRLSQRAVHRECMHAHPCAASRSIVDGKRKADKRRIAHRRFYSRDERAATRLNEIASPD